MNWLLNWSPLASGALLKPNGSVIHSHEAAPSHLSVDFMVRIELIAIANPVCKDLIHALCIINKVQQRFLQQKWRLIDTNFPCILDIHI